MPLATRRSYAGAAPACTLSSDISAGATSFSITGTTTNWPTTATGPFYMVIDPGLSTEEKVLVGARTSGSLSTVTRGVDGTTAASHVTGATCYPVFTAVDANDANLLASRLSAKGDLISSDGTDPTKVAVGSNNTRLVADSAQTSGIKWVADTQNTVVDAKGDLLVGSAADTVARLAVGANNTVLVADSAATNGVKWALLSGIGGAWTSYTPTFTQSGNVTHTLTYAKYIQIGKLVVVNVRLEVTGTGTAGVRIEFSLPVAASTSSLTRIGSGCYYDSSTDIAYNGTMQLTSASTTVSILPDGGGNYWGVFPNLATGNGDNFGFFAVYEAA